MAISIRLSEKESKLFKVYAEMNKVSVSELVREAVLDKIETEHDIEAYEKAVLEHKKNPVTFSLEDVENEIGKK